MLVRGSVRESVPCPTVYRSERTDPSILPPRPSPRASALGPRPDQAATASWGGFPCGELPRPGNPQFPSPRFRSGWETGRESPIPDSAGIGNRETPRFPIRPGPGIRVPAAAGRGRRAGDFLVGAAHCATSCRLANSQSFRVLPWLRFVRAWQHEGAWWATPVRGLRDIWWP
jgi:hypothetical protein